MVSSQTMRNAIGFWNDGGAGSSSSSIVDAIESWVSMGRVPLLEPEDVGPFF